jgi:hypothetical protein
VENTPDREGVAKRRLRELLFVKQQQFKTTALC